MGVDEPYDVPTDAWIKKYGVNIMYGNDKNYKYALFKKLYCQFDDIYTCSLFARSLIHLC